MSWQTRRLLATAKAITDRKRAATIYENNDMNHFGSDLGKSKIFEFWGSGGPIPHVVDPPNGSPGSLGTTPNLPKWRKYIAFGGDFAPRTPETCQIIDLKHFGDNLGKSKIFEFWGSGGPIPHVVDPQTGPREVSERPPNDPK